jgi:hypothetical protein
LPEEGQHVIAKRHLIHVGAILFRGWLRNADKIVRGGVGIVGTVLEHFALQRIE